MHDILYIIKANLFKYGFETDQYPVDKNRFSALLKKSCIASKYTQFSTNIEKNHKINTSFVTRGLQIFKF